MTRWVLVSGEFPPARGGVADYTALLAQALAAAGDQVHVFAPAPLRPSPGIVLHPLPGHFGGRARRQLDRQAAALAPAQWLIQYVPHAYGRKAMNVGFARWVQRRRSLQPWVMFHEVAVRAAPGDRARIRLLAVVTQHMARRMRRAAAHSWISIPGWDALLQQLAPGSGENCWLPVPSNLPTAVDAAAVASARSALAGPGGTLLGCFSRFEDHTRACLRPLLPPLLHADRARHALLIGPGGERLAAEVAAAEPSLGPRLHAPGRLEPAAAAAHIAAADLLLQPYADGLSTRRGTAMAGLALGRCLLSQAGAATEALWRDSGAVALLAADAAADAWLAAAEALLRDPTRRQALGAAARQLYGDHFALHHTVRRLRAAAAPGATA